MSYLIDGLSILQLLGWSILAKAKGTLWEGGIRVPAFVRWTGKINSGIVTQQLAITMDWTETILSAGGAKSLKDFPPDRINLMPILTGEQKNIERTFYWRTFQRNKQKAIRKGYWKYLQDEKGEYLFDLIVVLGEKNDVKAKEEAIFTRLKQVFADWEKTVLQAIPL